jgi:hypothetical protein
MRRNPTASRPLPVRLGWDRARQSKDFLAVIDADPSSPNYGHLLTTLVTDQTTMLVHHTEYTMPASGMFIRQ